MKKKITILLLGVLFIINLNAKEKETLKCGASNIRLADYLEKSDSPVVFIEKNYDIYYVLDEENKCNMILNQEMLDLYNQKYIENNISFEDTNRVLIVNKYNFKTIMGYSIDKNEYDSKKEYYYLNDEFNSIVKNDEEYDKDKEYYTLNYFRHVQNENFDSKKEYYFLKDPNNSIFELVDNEKIKDINILNVYEIVDYKTSIIDAKKYIMENSLIEKLINEHFKENEIVESNLLEINDELYLNLVYKNEKGKILRSFFYNSKGELQEKYNDVIFSKSDDYVVTYDKDYKKYKIFNKNFKVINKFEFDKETIYNSSHITENGIYISLTSGDTTKTYYYKNTSVLKTILIIICIALPVAAICYFVYKKILKK